MTNNDSLSYKNTGLWVFLVICGLICAFVIFLGIGSLWFGVKNTAHDGFWMPILTGTLSIILVLWLFSRLFISITSSMKEKDIIEF